MRPPKRPLVFLSEIGVLVLGFVVSAAIAILAAVQLDPETTFAALVFYAGLLLTVVCFFLLRRKTRPWKIEHDAAAYQLEKAERDLHPVRFRYKRVLSRAAIWLPSALAALVVFFFPIASHLACPNSHYYRHYRVPIPWTATVISPGGMGLGGDMPVIAFVHSRSAGTFGITPFWYNRSRFTSYFEFSRGWRRRGISWDGDMALGCSQHELPSRPFLERELGVGPLWEVVCYAGPPTENLHARFIGQWSDIAIFYKVVRGVTWID